MGFPAAACRTYQPLTTVTITLTAPEGVTIDTSKLRLANEYFTMTSAEVEDNKLTVVCNFIQQGEPINPLLQTRFAYSAA